MKLDEVRSYEDLETYLREFTTFHDDRSVYDFGGAFHLWLALLQNLKTNGLDAEMKQYAEVVSPDQVLFLKKLLQYAERTNTRGN
jgi:hypothetical protein